MLQIEYVNGKDEDIFNDFLKNTFDGVRSIIHDMAAKLVKIDADLNTTEREQIINFYQNMEVLTDKQRAKIEVRARVNEYRDFLINDKFSHEVNGVLHYFDCNDRSAIRLTALVQGASYHIMAGLEFVQVWRTSDNENITLNADQCLELFRSGREHEENAVFKAVYIKEMIESTDYATIEEIQNINVKSLWESTPWPVA